MKCLIIFSVLLAAAAAQIGQYDEYGRARFSTPAPLLNRAVSNEKDAQILTYSNEAYPDGSFQYAFNTDNGIAAEAQGTPKAFPGNPPVSPVVIQGAFSWFTPDGQTVTIRYIADEKGYQPTGDAIPTPPPIPEAILKSLEFIARNPQPQQK